MSSQLIAELSIWAVPTVFSIILHELMHGYVARSLGDDTAERAGRLTLNPLAHIDPIGTVVMPAVLLFFHLPVFGYAKPVPVNFGRLRNVRWGMVAVAAAGPITNLVLAFVSARAIPLLLAHRYGQLGGGVIVPLIYMAQASVVLNIALAVFNLFPLLPLDGGRVLAGLLPDGAARAFARTERFGFPILFILLYTGAVGSIIGPIIDALTRVLL